MPTTFNKEQNMNKFFYFLLLIFSFSCVTESSYEPLNPLNKAKWITDRITISENDSLLFKDSPAPIFRKEFNTERELKSATLYITAAGYYKATINNQEVGDILLVPAWTNFNKRVYYSEYDIKQQIKPGTNCVGVTLGNGFYNPLPLKMWGHLNLREKLPVGNPAFIAKLVLIYENGETEEIISDESWSFSYGPIIKNNVYLGDVYDARKEIKDWDTPGFRDADWKTPLVSNGPGGELQKAFFPPVKVRQTITPVKITSPQNEVYIVDMGVNFTGGYKIRVKGEKGDSIVFRFGERIYEDGTLNPMTTVCGQIKKKGSGGPGAPDIAWQTDSYIIGENENTWYSPTFTFHTFRYMEIDGLKYQPEINDIQGLAFNSDIENTNHFSCSSELINSIQEATVRTFQSNLISVQSDCPAREKFGYGGDLNATSESFIYNFDMHSFYKKTIYDWVDAINDSIFIDTAPYVGLNYCGISWESAFLTTQYYLYLYYGDTDIIKELYNFDTQWMEKVARIHPEGVVNEGLSDHESLEPVPVQLTGTCHYLQCARIMKTFARIMGDTNREKEYGKLAEELRVKIKTLFWDNPVTTEINKQTLYASLIYYDILPEADSKAVTDSLMKALNNGISGHFTTGIFGTKFILEALSRNENANSVFNVVNNTQYPGWGYMIHQGATTIWETWKESDNIFSNCHPMFGSVTEWFFRWLAGIQPIDETPGFETFNLTPQIPDDLKWIKSNYVSPYGEIKSEWKKENQTLVFNFQIPIGTSCNFKIPDFDFKKVSIKRRDSSEIYWLKNDELISGFTKLKEGDYEITAFWNN